MNIRRDIKEFVQVLELYAKRKLHFNAEVGELIQIVTQTGCKDEFYELIFNAKFLVKTQELMKRIGPGADGFEKLSMEFQSSVKKSVDILKTLVSKSPLEVSQKFNNTFLVMETDSYQKLMLLLSDLSWLKNWQLDGKLLPFEENYGGDREKIELRLNSKGKPLQGQLSRIKKSALLSICLLIILLMLDSPVTIIGWLLSLGILGLLMYIVYEIYYFIRI